jgi:hypothetical protein
MIKLPFGVGNCMWRMPSEFRLSSPKTKTRLLIDSAKGMPRGFQYARAWANPITVRCAPVSMHAPFQQYIFLLRSAMACNDLVEKNNLFNRVGLNRRCSRLCRTRILCLSTLATSVADIEALDLARRCRYKRGVLPAMIFNFSQVEQLRNFENLYRRDAR